MSKKKRTDKINKALGILLLGVMVGLAGYLGNAPVPQRQSIAFAGTVTDTTDLDAALTSLPAKLDRSTKRQKRRGEKVVAIGKERSDGVTSPVEGEQNVFHTPEATRRRAEQRLAEQKYIMAAVLEAEDQDPYWSAVAQQGLYESFAFEQDLGIHVVDVTCRSSLCGAEFAFDGTVPDEAMYRNMLDRVPWSGQRYVEMSVDVDGPYIFMYIAREGHHLPELTGSMG